MMYALRRWSVRHAWLLTRLCALGGAVAGVFLFELIDQIDQIDEALPGTGADYSGGHGDAQMGFAGTGRNGAILSGV